MPEMRYVGLEPSKYKTIRRKLQFHNVLVEEIKAVDPCFTKKHSKWEDHFDVDALFPADSGPFQYDEWSRVNTDAGQRMNIVSKSSDRASFIKLFKPQLFEFKEMSIESENQYHALQDLKANLPRNHMIVQMDFAENFNCKTADEVQSSYFNKCYVSLHPVVVYYKVNDTLHHKKFYIYFQMT
ncbi:unnamed protein product [Mytilus coruscus]|uniref:Uncharacterized protein n=1 Tax=Mytilus coruscus TaxID=42192 RepID=A0A6J8D8H1_MYTCO|nr:unnamed protein product [Mytilus coruscus]